jgi:hypothetical protein
VNILLSRFCPGGRHVYFATGLRHFRVEDPFMLGNPSFSSPTAIKLMETLP